MAYIKGRFLNPQRGEGYHGAFLGIAQGAVSENDIVIAVGYSGDQVKFIRADADAAGLHAGLMGVAKHDAAADETLVVLSHKLVKNVDTSGVTAAGYPVYLGEAPGSFDDAEPSPNTMVVGSVLHKDNTVGVVILAPGRMTYGIESDGTPDITHGS